jgi:type 1 fimbria pilin
MTLAEVVMKASGWRVSLMAGTAVAGMVLCGVTQAAPAADGGTISFSGAVVAPGFRIASMAPRTTGVPGGASASQDGSAVIVLFNAPSGTASGADVRLLVNDGIASRTDADALRDVSARFSNQAGAAELPYANGHFRLPVTGGALSLRERSADVAPVLKPVTVVVSYD